MSVNDSGRYRWVVLLLTCCLCFLGNFSQYQVSAYATQVMPALGIDAVGFSMLFLTPMLAAVFFSLPFGALGDRVGPKAIVFWGFCFSVLGSIVRIVTMNSFVGQLVAMFLLGIGMAALTANNVKTLGLWFGERTGTAMGIYYAVSCLGIAAAQASSAVVPLVRDSYVLSAAALCVCTALWGLLGRNVVSDSDIPEDAATAPSFKVALRSKSIWLLTAAISFSLTATTAFAGVLPQALELERDLSAATSGGMAAALTVASLFGCLAAPALCARFKSTKTYLVGVCLTGAMIMAASWFAPDTGMLWPLLMLNGFATSMMGPVMQAMPVMLPEIGSRYAGSAGGIIAELSLLSCYVLPIAIASVAGGNYTAEMVLIAACYALAAVPVVFLPKAIGATPDAADAAPSAAGNK